jgi:curved DNA-binding protein CbpA
MEKVDLYKALEVSKEASQDEIRRSYRRLARKYHPDANPGDRQRRVAAPGRGKR